MAISHKEDAASAPRSTFSEKKIYFGTAGIYFGIQHCNCHGWKWVTTNAHANTMKTFCAKALRGAQQLRGHGAAVSAIWAIAPGHDSTVAPKRGHGAESSGDLILFKDALAINGIDAMVAKAEAM